MSKKFTIRCILFLLLPSSSWPDSIRTGLALRVVLVAWVQVSLLQSPLGPWPPASPLEWWSWTAYAALRGLRTQVTELDSVRDEAHLVLRDLVLLLLDDHFVHSGQYASNEPRR